MNGDPNIDGFVNGKYNVEKLEPDMIIDRYSFNLHEKDTGKFLAPANSTFESRALPPISETQNYTKYKVLKPIEVKSGGIAPWFDQPGGGIQYFTDSVIKDMDGNMVEATVKNLLENGYIQIIE